MRTALFCLILTLTSAVLGDEAPAENSRSYLKDIMVQKGEKARSNEFEFPFLLTSTGKVKSSPAPETARKVGVWLKKTLIPVESHVSGSGVSAEKLTVSTLAVPSAVITGNQLEAIKSCSTKHCLMKLNIEKEKGIVEKAANKVSAYQDLVLGRVKSYLSRQTLLGYEDRDDNVEYIKKALAQLDFLKTRYPHCTSFLEQGLWKGAKPPSEIKRSFVRQDVLNIQKDQLQPVWEISEVFVCEEGGATVFFEPTIYSNHYFDSSLRVIEVLPLGEKSVAIFNDVHEVDELTKSGLVRMLYKGKMQSAVDILQDELLDMID